MVDQLPGLAGTMSAASSTAAIVSQAQDALASAVGARVPLRLSTEEGAVPPDYLAEFHNPLMVLVPYSAPATMPAVSLSSG